VTDGVGVRVGVLVGGIGVDVEVGSGVLVGCGDGGAGAVTARVGITASDSHALNSKKIERKSTPGQLARLIIDTAHVRSLIRIIHIACGLSEKLS
jgi:hypothetical protein